MNFLDLPEEIQLYIFRYVPKHDLGKRVRLTCKTFYDLTFDPCLWHHIEINKYKLDSSFYLDLLQRVSGHVEHISTRHGRHSNLAILGDKTVTFPGLQSIDLDLESENIDLVNSFLCRHPAVKDISLSGPLTDVLSVVNTLSNLPSLNLRKICFSCTDEDGCEDMHFDGLVNFVLQNKHLEILAIYCDELSDDAVQCMLSFKDIALKCISLNDCSRISQIAFSGIEKVTSLVSLSLDNTNVDDNALDQVAQNCPNLQRLSVQGCALVTDVGFVHIAEHCGQLQDLIVNSLEMQSPTGRNITDLGLTSLAHGCPRLKRLVVNKCPGVSSTGLIEIAKHCRDLEEIRVAECLSVTDASAIALAVNCSALRIVNLNSCLQITSEAVNRLVVACNNLHSLHLETCRFMSKLKFDDIITNNGGSGMDHVGTINGQLDSGATDSDGKCDTFNPETPIQMITEERPLGTTSTVKQNVTMGNYFDIQDPRNAMSADYGVTHTPSKFKNVVLSSETRNRGQEITKDNNQKSKTKNVASRDAQDTQIASKTQTVSDEYFNNNSSGRNKDKLNQNRQERPKQANIREFHYSISPQHSHLRVLHFGFSSSLTDASVRQIARHCPDLVDLSIRGCHSLSDSAIRFLLQRCRRIETLDISGGSAVKATNLTDTCLLAVAEYSQNIRKLYIMKNDIITTDAARVVIQKCRHLDSICVSCSKNSAITSQNATAMARTLPRRVSVTMDSHISAKGALVIKCLE
ncbi:dynein regulatory complex subunit 6-like [Pecten maximus]|uniref:dynein regulatory complex subunit 6-like n=1 Tax=Pecten maximus TaxID=6579 RepID=UPI001459049B|nr:dynein regulatory complex subunit 6-like [Pecten maximus]